MNSSKLLSLLNAHNVKYVIIGASAMPVHGFTRATKDIDIFIEATKENAERTMAALKECGYDLTDLAVDEMLEKKILLRQYILETDIHPFVTGTTWDNVWRSKVMDKLNDIPTCFASLDELIKMKKAAGRGKDLDDLSYLLKIRKKKQSP